MSVQTRFDALWDLGDVAPPMVPDAPKMPAQIRSLPLLTADAAAGPEHTGKL